MKITTENETSDESDNDDCGDISIHNTFPTGITHDDESFKLSIDAIKSTRYQKCLNPNMTMS